MQRAIAVSALVLIGSLCAASPPAEAQQAKNLTEFCGVWRNVCNRTCPSGPGNCRTTCAERHTVCMATQCFPFNRPGPRCYTDATARELTDPKYAPDPQRARERRERAREGSGSR